MKRLYIIFVLILIVAAIILVGCSTESTSPEPGPSEELILTIDELSQYDGTDGNPAYIAVDGVIYDVTNVGEWNGGGHNGFAAGNDLTNEIKTISPHGVSKLEGIPIVGKLAE